MKKEKTKKGRHSRVFLSGISLLCVVHQTRKRIPCFTKTWKAGDPRLRHSGMTALFNKAFTLPSSSRSVFMRDIKSFLLRPYPALQACGVTRPEGVRGFTLIELLVVVLIIGILAAIALPQYEKAVERSRVAEAKLNLNTMKRNYELCVLEFGEAPDSECVIPDDFILNHLTVPLSGELETVVINCPLSSSSCFKTKDWVYETDDATGFGASRIIGDSSPYYLFIDYSDGMITCTNQDTSSKDYCKMLCGGDGCAL